ncbi:MAG: hypothetical protein WBI43_06195 [Bacillota bacterium]
MSRFLRVGIFLDRLEDIAEAANLLSEAIQSGEDANLPTTSKPWRRNC